MKPNHLGAYRLWDFGNLYEGRSGRRRQKQMNFLARYENRSKLFWIVLGLVLIGVVGILDYLTGYEASVLLFYLVPISIITWYTGQRH